MFQIDQREGTVSFAAIRRVLRDLFSKNHGGGPSDPPTSTRVKVRSNSLTARGKGKLDIPLKPLIAVAAAAFSRL